MKYVLGFVLMVWVSSHVVDCIVRQTCVPSQEKSHLLEGLVPQCRQADQFGLETVHRFGVLRDLLISNAKHAPLMHLGMFERSELLY